MAIGPQFALNLNGFKYQKTSKRNLLLKEHAVSADKILQGEIPAALTERQKRRGFNCNITCHTVA